MWNQGIFQPLREQKTQDDVTSFLSCSILVASGKLMKTHLRRILGNMKLTFGVALHYTPKLTQIDQ